MTTLHIRDEIALYHRDVAYAQNEGAKKLRFQNLLVRLFNDNPEARQVVNALAQGGEKTIFNIPRRGSSKTGFADISYNNVIIEWEKDLQKTGLHAQDQLAEYLAGQWHSGERYDYVLIATDGKKWRCYAPDLEALLAQATPDRTTLRQTEEFELKDSNEEAFYFFLDRLLFQSTRRRATLKDIQLDFGDSSSAFINTHLAMQRVLPAADIPSTVHVAFEQWQRFLQLAYGKFDDRPAVYLVHTYLSVFAKFLAYAVLKPNASPKDEELLGILTGETFQSLNVSHFVEGDFFYWVATSEFFEVLKPAFRELYNRISEYDFTDVEEDILKGVYQELIDLDTRHSLGEYYTPDWLCERVVADLSLESHHYSLDPACGSGSFLRALVSRYRQLWPHMPASQLARQIIGIDVHPLSVQIAKTTMLLAMGDQVAKASEPVVLHVHLANTLFLSKDEGNKSLFTTGYHFNVKIDKETVQLDVSPFLGQSDNFNKAIELAQHFIDSQLDRPVPEAVFGKALSQRLDQVTLGAANVTELHRVYLAMRQAKLDGRDSIWQFVLQNLYQPVFMYKVFDVVVANPPWLTFADISSADYQDTVRTMASHYNLLPKSKANNPHVDLAALFMSHCGRYLAKDGAQLAFVLPRAFLSADQHHNARSGDASGFKLTEVWDLDGVSPLFNVPACVLMASATHSESNGAGAIRALPKNGIVGRSFSGRLPASQIHWDEAKALLTDTPTRWFMQTLGQAKSRKKRSALVQTKLENSLQGNAYQKLFKQGATMVPRSFYFVLLQGEQHVSTANNPAAFKARIHSVKTHPLAVEGAKKPWNELTLTGQLQGQYLFRTALSRNVLPFALINPALVALPLVQTQSQWQLLTPDELTQRGHIEASRFFAQGERLWTERRSENAVKQKMDAADRLDYQRGLTGQPLNPRWAVIYTASATDASACVLHMPSFVQPFLAESTTYIFFTENVDEAHYVSSFLNSGYANGLIKEFQARGLFGPRHVHKKILELSWPRFDTQLPLHRELARLGQTTAAQVQTLLGTQQDLELNPRILGRLRSQIRVQLVDELMDINALVEAISTGREPKRFIT
jgi:type I restriction-modification system DNA methylase subunit